MSNQEDGVLLEFKYFLILDGVIVLGILIWLLRRPKRSQMRLKMSAGAKKQAPLARHAPSQAVKAEPDLASNANTARQLTIRFNYNGHSFEAYEALGLPAGSSLQAAEEAFKNTSVTGKESQEFLRAALEAIRRSS